MKLVVVVFSIVFICTGFLWIGDNASTSPFLKDKLSDYNLFEGALAEMNPAEGVMPYDLNTPLFSDYASKARFIYLPKGESANYNAEKVLDFPKGTIIAKTFYYPKDQRKPEKGNILLETRILIHEEAGWKALPYVWNEKQSEAYLDVAGTQTEVQWKDEKGKKQKLNYSVPNMNQCKGCHSYKNEIHPIGPSVRQLNKDYHYAGGKMNQLKKWESNNILTGMPKLDQVPKLAIWNKPSTGTIDERARAYLEINCAHCHNRYGPANTSGLFLDVHEIKAEVLGVNKAPIAAGRGSGGRKVGIAPGKPDESILLYRMESDDSGVMMPELGRKLIHDEGIKLIRDWIAEMQ